jgi:hypothetical protein
LKQPKQNSYFQAVKAGLAHGVVREEGEKSHIEKLYKPGHFYSI